MSYAVRSDGVYGIRAVDSELDCLENEYFSDVFIESPEMELIDTLPNLSQYQFRMCLINNNLYDQVMNGIDSIEDNKQKLRVKTSFEYARFFNRKDELVMYMCDALGLTEDQVNTMWQEALTY